MPQLKMKIPRSKRGVIYALRQWLRNRDAEFVMSDPFMDIDCQIVVGVLFPEHSEIEPDFSALLEIEGIEYTISEDKHLSPFHDTVGDVPFDGINGCESPFK